MTATPRLEDLDATFHPELDVDLPHRLKVDFALPTNYLTITERDWSRGYGPRLPDSFGDRAAEVYLDAHNKTDWLVRFEQRGLPDHGYASGWAGGRVSFRSATPDRREAIMLALRWIVEAQLPEDVRH